VAEISALPAEFWCAGIALAFHPPHLEQGDHLRRRQFSTMVLMVSSLLAIVLSFVNSRVALWVLALNFAAPLLRKWSHRAAELD
jgi:hypothetical protein